MANNQITFGVGFKVDESGLKTLRSQLQEIQRLTAKDLTLQFGDQATDQLAKTKAAAARVEQALNKAFNTRLNSLNITQFNKELEKSGYTSRTLAQELAAAGSTGVRAFNDIAAKSLTLNTQLKQSSGFLAKMGETLTNTIRWNIASSAVNAFTSSIQGAFNYVESLDRSLTSIRIVTGESREEMARFAVEANNAAQALGRQTKEYTNAALTFYQQGLNDEQVQARTEAVLKAQNITNSGSEMADYLTAVWNGFRVTAEETTEYVDKLAAVADSSASDMSELAVAMSKVASTASNMGVTVDQLTAQIATIVATTRVAPETVGNALKTIYARINDIKAGTDEAEISLGQYTGRMASLGISVLDSDGRLRDTGDVMTEIGEKWASMTREQQIYLAQTMAGQRQMNNLVSLFDNWQTYTDMLNVSLNSTGTLEEKNARYLDSIEAHLKTFRAAVEGFQDSLINEGTVKSIYDLGTGFFNFARNIVDAIGGMRGAALGLGTLLTNILNQQITTGVANAVQGWHDWIDTNETLTQSIEWVKNQYQDLNVAMQDANASRNQKLLDSLDYSRNRLAQMRQDLLGYERLMTNEQRAQYNTLLDEQKVNNDNLIILKQQLDIAKQYYSGRESMRIEQGLAPTNRFDIYTFSQASGLDINLDQRHNIDSMVEVLDDLHYTIQDNITELDKLITRFSRLGEHGVGNLSKLERKYRQLQEQVSRLGSNNIGYAVNQLSEEDQRDYFNFQSIQEDAKNYFNELQVLLNSSTKPLGQHSDAIQQIIDKYNSGNISLSVALRSVSKELNVTETELGHRLTVLRSADERRQQWRKELKETTDAFDLLKTALRNQQFGQAVADVTKGLSQILFSISTLANIPKVFQQIHEGSISLAQGFLQVSRSFVMGLPAMISGISKLSTSFDAIKKDGPEIVNNLLRIIAARITNRQAQKAEAQGTLKNSAAQRIETITTEADAVAHTTNTVAIEGENAARAQSLQLITEYIGSLMPWIAGVAAVAATIYIVYKALNAENEALERLQNNLHKSQDAYTELKNKYDELKTAFDEYQGMVDTTQQLQVGTEAWYDAIDNVNDKVYELLTQYPELAEYVKEVNGQLEIEAEGREKLLKLRQQEKVSARQQVIANQIAVNNQPSRVTAQNIRANSFVSAGFVSTDQILRVANKLNDDVGLLLAFENNDIKTLQTYTEELHLASREQLQGILAQTTALNDLRLSLQKAENRNINLTKAYLAETYRESELFKDMSLERQEAVFSIAAKSLRLSINREDNGVTDAQRYDYALRHGYSYSQAHDQQGNALGKGIFRDSEGNIVDILDDTIALELNERVTLPKTKNAVGWVTQNVDESMHQRILSFVDGMQGSFDTLTEDEIKNASTFIQENWKELGIDSKFDAKQLTDQAEKNYNLAVEQVFKNISDTPKQALLELQSSKAFENTSLQFKQQYGQFLQDVFIKDSKLYDQVLKVSPRTLLNALSNSVTFEDFAETLQKGGEAALFTGDQLQILYQLNHNTVQQIIEDFGKIYDETRKLAEKDYGFGDIVSKDEIETIQQLGIDISNFFLTLENGSAVLIRSRQELERALFTSQLNQYLPTRQTLLTQIQDRQNIDDNRTDLYGKANSDASEELFSRINILEEFGKISAQQAAEMRYSIETTGQLSENYLTIINDNLQSVNQSTRELEELDQQLFQTEWNLANLARNSAELQDFINQGWLTNNSARVQQREITFDQRENYGDLDNTEIEEYRNYLNSIAGKTDEVTDEFLNNSVATETLAQSVLRMEQGYSVLIDTWSEWNDILQNESLKTTREYQETLQDARAAIADLLDINEQWVSDDFIVNHLETIGQALDGTQESYDQLRDALAEEVQLNIFNDLATAELPVEKLSSQWDALQTHFNHHGLVINADDGPALDQIQNYVDKAGMSATQIQGMFDSIGWEPVFETETKEVEQHVPIHVTETVTEPTGTDELTGFPINRYRTVTYQDGFKDIVGSMDVVAMSSDGTPKIKEIIKKGNANLVSQKAKTSSGGGSSKKPKKIEAFKSKTDPYHDVNIKLKDNEQTLKNLQKQQEKTFGGGTVKNLLQQVQILAKERDLLKEKFDINVDQLHIQQEQLKNYGVTFDALGRISNYESILKSKRRQINSLIDQANAMADGDARDAIEERISLLKTEYSTLESLISEYDSSSDQLQELYDSMTDYLDQIFEDIQKMANTEIDIRIELKEDQKKFNEFKSKIIDQVQDDDFLGQAIVHFQDLDLIMNDDGDGLAQKLGAQVADILAEVNTINAGGVSMIYGTDISAAREDLKKYYEETMSQLEEYYDEVDRIKDLYLDSIDAMKDAFDDQLDQYDKVADTLEQDLNLIQLLNRDDDYEKQQRIYDLQKENDQRRVDMRQFQLAVLLQQLQQTEKGTEAYEKLKDRTIEAYNTLNSSIQQAAESAAAAWENAMKAMRQATDRELFGDTFLFHEEWDRMDWHSDRYLEPFEKANALLDLQADFNKEINNASEKNRKNLLTLRDKLINKLSQQEHIRQSDVDLANKELELARAQMELEDARNSRTTLRLRRDSQGNYTYQYVADQDKITDATKRYRDALEAYRQQAQTTLDDIRHDLDDAYEEAQDKLYEYMDLYKNYEDGQERALAAWTEWYQSTEGKVTLIAEELKRQLEEVNDAIGVERQGLSNLYGIDKILELIGPTGTEAWSNGFTTAIEQLGNNIWQTIINGAGDAAETIQDTMRSGLHGLDPMYDSAIDQMADIEYTQSVLAEMAETANTATKEYADTLKEVEEISGVVFDDYITGADKALQFNDSLLTSNEELTNSWNDLVNDALANYTAALDELAARAPELQALFDILTNTDNVLQTVDFSNVAADLEAAKAEVADQLGLTPSTDALAERITKNSAAGLNSTMPTYLIQDPLTVGTVDATRLTSNQFTRQVAAAINTVAETLTKIRETSAEDILNSDLSSTSSLQNDLVSKYNQYIVDQLASIDFNMLERLADARNLTSAVANNNETNLNQEVHIDASFPNVQSAAEIEKAFNNLVNLASQRANTNRRRNN